MSKTEATQDLNERFIPDLKLDLILYSPTNPRKFIDKDKLKELADSIRTNGVVEPIVCRPAPKKAGFYELVAGERRHRASVLAKKDFIPTIIRSYTDQQAAEVQQIENIQRADVHPMDEGHGFKTLIADFQYTPASIAEKISKTVGYVLRRIKLTDMIPKLQEAFWTGDIPLAHAEYICRFTTHEQEIIDKEYLWLYNEEIQSLKQVRDNVERNLLTDISKAPWKADADFKGLGPCATCPKLSGNVLQLFPEYNKQPNVCTDRECFDKKMDITIDLAMVANSELVRISSSWHDAVAGLLSRDRYVLIEGKACGSAKKGIYVNGERAGKQVKICFDPKCPAHKGQTSTSHRSSNANEAENQRKWRINAAGLYSMFKAAWDVPAGKINHFTVADIRMLANYAWERAYNRDKVAKAIGWERVGKEGSHKSFHPVADAFIKKASLPELVKFTMLMVCNGEVGSYGYNAAQVKDLPVVAKQWGVDVLKARAATVSELELKYKAKSAKKGGKKK